ncbi:MAG: hypothetical protein KatS3mg042_0876 [Rhodothermaceae bacterium]|nr:MAG: hypothetical protein KatS3mg042_0876 [Rhodothermaceae bacterium]
MSNPLVEPLLAHLLDAFPPERDYAPEEVARAPMPPMVAHFLAQRVQGRMARAVERLREDVASWCATDHPEVREATSGLAGVLVRHARIPRTAWEEMLREAVAYVTDYLVRPVDTLVRFVFQEGDGPLPAHVVTRRLGHFAAYPYLRAAVEAYVERKGPDAIDRPRLAELLSRVDRQMTEGYEADQWLTLLEPLLRLGGSAGVPVDLLQAFFAEKGARDLAARLEAAARGGTSRLGAEALHRLLAGRDVPPPAAPPVASASPAATSSGEAVVPLWKKFMAAPPAPSPVAPAADPGAVPLWMRFRASAGAGDADLPALERAILGEHGHLDRDRYIKQLFSGSAEAYERVLRRLYAAPSWAQASQIIAQDVFKAHQVNIYSPTAIAFTNAVEARYRGGEPD